MLYLFFHMANDYQNRLCKNRYKIDKVMAYGIGPPCIKSHDSLIRWLYIVSWQIKHVTPPIPNMLWTPKQSTKHIIKHIRKHNPQNTSLFVKSYFHSWTFLHLRIIPLILHTATIRLLLLVRGKKPPVLTFLNLYVTLNGIDGSIWYFVQLNFISLPLFYKCFLFLTGFWLAWKKVLQWNCFFLKCSHFCAVTSILWQTCLHTRLIYNFRFPIWNKIHDWRSRKISDHEIYSRSAKVLKETLGIPTILSR